MSPKMFLSHTYTKLKTGHFPLCHTIARALPNCFTHTPRSRGLLPPFLKFFGQRGTALPQELVALRIHVGGVEDAATTYSDHSLPSEGGGGAGGSVKWSKKNATEEDGSTREAKSCEREASPIGVLKRWRGGCCYRENDQCGAVSSAYGQTR